eukprot:1146760-Pelagomonas_calceolata.AAC.6
MHPSAQDGQVPQTKAGCNVFVHPCPSTTDSLCRPRPPGAKEPGLQVATQGLLQGLHNPATGAHMHCVVQLQERTFGGHGQRVRGTPSGA